MRLLMGITKSRHGTTYYAIKKVPPRLQEAVARVLDNGKLRQVWLKRSLSTKDVSEANKRAKAVLTEFDRTLERAEALTAPRPLVTSLSLVLIKRMAEYHYARKLASHDEYLRVGPENERAMRELDPDLDWDWPIPSFGLSQGQVADANVTILEVLQEAEAALAQGNIGHIEFQIEQVLDAFQINLDHKCSAYRELGLALLRAEVRAFRAIQQRQAGEPIETPPLPQAVMTASATGETLHAAFDGWKRQREHPAGTLDEYERAIKMFAELNGDLPVAQIKRNHGRQFREALQEVPARRSGKLLNASLPELAKWGHEHPDVPKITAGTVNKHLTAVQAIANWALDNGMIPDDVQWADPFRRMRLGEEEAVRGGAPFVLADLQVIFCSSVFTKGERPKGGKGEAAFWLPFLALFIGARLNELASLKAADVAHSDVIGAQCIFIKAEKRSGKRLKTEQSERFVPVHPQLIAAGFLEYVSKRRTDHSENAWLFSDVAPGTNGKAAFSKWFGRYIGAQGITDSSKVFHSFRHSFVDALRLAGVPGEIIIALLGHTDPSMTSRYGAKDKAIRFRHRLAEAISGVTYTGLDLSHLSRRTT